MEDRPHPISYSEFLALARDEGLVGLDISLMQSPNESNSRTAIVQAIARSREVTFSTFGEASPTSAPPGWLPFLTTLAELRAKARALREFTGLEHAVVEELKVPYADPEDESSAHITESVNVDQSKSVHSTNGARPVRTPGAPRAIASVAEDWAVASPDQAAPAVETDTGTDEDESEPSLFVDSGIEPARDAAYSSSRSSAQSADGEAIGRDMEAKLLKLAISIAALEGQDVTESEARQKLDDFFLRAFKHPLARANKIEGQRVVQRLSSELARLHAQAAGEKA